MDFSQYEHSTSEWKAYLAQNPKLLVDGGIPKAALSDFRQASNDGRARWSTAQIAAQGLEGKFRMKDYEISTRDGTKLRMRRYSPATESSSTEKLPAFIHLHGGGFLNGSIETETSIGAAVAVGVNAIVLHPEYRHTDTVSDPTMFDDVWDAFEWIFGNAERLDFDANRVTIGGQSAGSGLAATTVQHDVKLAKAQGRACRVKGQVLTIPWLLHPDAFPFERFANREVTSPVQCTDKIGLSAAKLDWFASLLHAANPGDPRLSPGLQQGKQLEGVPRAAFLVAGGDPLRDQGLLYATSLEQANIDTKVHVFPAVPHTFRSCDGLPSAKLFVQRLIESIRWALDEQTALSRPGDWHIENAS